MTEVASVLPLAVEEIAPPQGMRERVLGAAVQGQRVPPPAKPGLQVAPPRHPRRLSWAYPFAAAAVLLLAVGGWNVYLQDRLRQTDAQLARVQAETSHGTLVAAHGASAGSVSYLAQDHLALVSLHAVGAPPPGKTYQLWVIDGNGRADPAGVFLPETDGTKVLVISRSLSPSDKVAVTVEPLGGSGQPTSSAIITGSL